MKTPCNPFPESEEGKMYAWALGAFGGPLSELLEHERTHPVGRLDVALTAALEAKRHEMIHGG